ncbi:hypothetical protein C9925_02380 [cyanobacterium G8-9]|nr:hypothetical protein C9925_02380 [cyanobacterium G8-9]
MDEMWENDDETLIEKLRKIKEHTITHKSEELSDFLKYVNQDPHPYLSDDEIHKALKSMPPETPLHHAPISFNSVEKILTNISNKYDVFESTDHIIIEKEKNHDLFGTILYYTTSVSYEKPHQRFSDKQFALFPLKRLDYDKEYHVKVSYKSGSKKEQISWRFHTNLPRRV